MMKRLLLLVGAVLACSLPSLAQVQPIALPQFQFFSDDGVPLAGGKVCSYVAGTSTLQATFTDSTGTVQNADPVILDSAGRASIWFGPQSYKVVVRTAGTDNTCSTGSVVWSQDNIPGAGQSIATQAFSAVTAATNSNTGTFAMSGNTLDLSAATAVVLPVSSGVAPTADGSVAYDSMAKKYVFGQNSGTVSFGVASSGACSSGQFVSTPATATTAASCSAPSISGTSGSGLTISSSTLSGNTITGGTIGSTTLSSSTISGSTIGTSTLTSPTVNTTIAGNAFQAATSSGCTTSSGVAGTCTATVTFGSAFADTSYLAVCQSYAEATAATAVTDIAIVDAQNVSVTLTNLTTMAGSAAIVCIGKR